MLDTSRWYIRLGNWAFNLFLLNILWFLFSLAGLILFGLFPATAAMFAVLRRMIMEDNQIPVLKLFLENFKQEFLKANLIGYLVLAVGIILYLDIRVLQLIENDSLRSILLGSIYVVGAIYVISTLYIFPVFVHYQLKVLQYPKYALILAVGRPFHTVLLLAGLICLYFLFTRIPVLVPVFGISLSGYMIMFVSAMSLPKKQSFLE